MRPIAAVIEGSVELSRLRESSARRGAHQRIRTLEDFLAEDHRGGPALVDGLLPAEGLCLLLGAEKTGKSLLAILLALCVAAGIPFLGRKTQPCPVLLIEEEGSAEHLQQRLRSVIAALGISAASLPLHVINRSSWRLDAPDDIADIEACMLQLNIKLVVMGPLAQLAEVQDENKAAGFNNVARNVLDLAARAHALVVLSHHRRKPDPRRRHRLSVREFFDTSRGANALTAAMDVGLGLDRDPESPTGELLMLARDEAPARLRIRFDASTLTFAFDAGAPTSREQSEVDRLRAELGETGAISAEQAKSVLGVSLNTAKARLRMLEEDGFLARNARAGAATIWTRAGG